MILSEWVTRNKELFKGKRVLEVGSGPGLAGLACALCECKQIVLTDYKPEVMKLIAQNI